MTKRLPSVYQDDDTTIVAIADDYAERTFLGKATRHPEDDVNHEIGLRVAYARALERQAKFHKKQADGAVKHADDMRLDKQRRVNEEVDRRVKRKIISDLDAMVKNLLNDPFTQIFYPDTADEWLDLFFGRS